jgi:hypothetical protein
MAAAVDGSRDAMCVIRLIQVAGSTELNAVGNWQERLAPELALMDGFDAIRSACDSGFPWALLALTDGIPAALRSAREATAAGHPPVHVLLCLGVGNLGALAVDDDGAASEPLPCPVTALVPLDGPRQRADIVVAPWRQLTAAHFTVRLLPTESDFRHYCDAATAQVIKEELRVWPA